MLYYYYIYYSVDSSRVTWPIKTSSEIRIIHWHPGITIHLKRCCVWFYICIVLSSVCAVSFTTHHGWLAGDKLIAWFHRPFRIGKHLRYYRLLAHRFSKGHSAGSALIRRAHLPGFPPKGPSLYARMGPLSRGQHHWLALPLQAVITVPTKNSYSLTTAAFNERTITQHHNYHHQGY